MKLTTNQTLEFSTTGGVYGENADILVTVRYDDELGLGHNTFSITGEVYKAGRPKTDANYIAGGCIHDVIDAHFPELRHLIKWHLVSSDGPMHYIANTTYLAGDKDYNGLREGDVRQIRNGLTGKLCWVLEKPKLPKYLDQDEPPTETETLRYVPMTRIGEGKKPDIESARKVAIWPDATLEQLQDRFALEARLPALMAEFKKDIESLGFTY